MLHHNHTSDHESDTGRLLGLTLATHRYRVHHCRINTHEIAIYSEGGFSEGGEEMLAISGLNGRFLHYR